MGPRLHVLSILPGKLATSFLVFGIAQAGCVLFVAPVLKKPVEKVDFERKRVRLLFRL